MKYYPICGKKVKLVKEKEAAEIYECEGADGDKDKITWKERTYPLGRIIIEGD